MQTKLLFCSIAIALLFFACKKSNNEKSIVGKWRMTQVYSVSANPQGWYNLPDTEENYYYFGADGSFSTNEPTVPGIKYQIISDTSYILRYKLETGEERTESHIFFLKEDELILKNT